MNIQLPAPYAVISLSAREFADYFKAQRELVYGSVSKLDVMGLLDKQEKQLLHELGGRLRQRYSLYLQFLADKEPIGFSYGIQTEADTFHMVSTALSPAHRGQGLYTAFLKCLIPQLKAAGFQKIQSYHHPGNTGVLIPKLKSGFVITGTELNEVYGFLLKVCYFTNPLRREAWEVRTGGRKKSADLEAFLDL